MSRDRRILDRHFHHWRERGLLAPDLEASLRRASAELDSKGGSTLVRAALALLGGGLLLAGLTLVVAENWDALHRGVKLAGWGLFQVGLLFAAHESGRRLPGRPYLAEAFAFVAGGWVLAGVALVSQIYHLDARPPNGVWLWLAVVLPAAWALRRRGVTAVVFVALAAALTLEVATAGSWVHLGGEGDGPWLWLGIPLLAGFAVSWLPARWPALPDGLGLWVFGAGTVFLLVFGAAHELDGSDLGRAWAVAGAGLATALAAPGRVLPRAWGGATSRLVLVLTFVPWAMAGARFEQGVAMDLLAVGAAWVVQLAIAVLVIRAGVRAGSKVWINLGYLAILAGILTRYFDFFGDFLEGGTALALTGLLILFILFALERARRRTLRTPTTEASR